MPPASRARMAEQVGRVLGGRYRLVAPIGTGASAHVYVADDVSLRRRVAVKVLHAALAEDEAFLRRFRAEARAVAALRHPNIMSVYDWGEAEDGPYLVLEHLGGGSLRDLLDSGTQLSPSQALMVGLEAARALDYAHRRGLVHRDIKPANLLFDDEGRLCVADFGLARALAEASSTEPAGALLGTARYASPEQARGGSVDGKSDVYALALVLVEAVTGRVPFAADTTIATLMGRLDRPIEAPDELGALAPAITVAGTVDPADRADAASFARALDTAARDLPSPQPLPVAGPPTIDLTSSSTDEAGLTQLPAAKMRSAVYDVDEEGFTSNGRRRASRGGRRRRWPKIVAALVLVSVLAGGGAYAVTQARIPTHPVPSVRELTVAQAASTVRDEEFTIRISRQEYSETMPKGQILDQDPSSGRLKEGRAIRVVVSLGPQPRAVPDLSNLNREAAQGALTGAGFTTKFEETFHATIAAGIVLDWRPRSGRQEKGTEVTVVLSAGPEPKPVPGILDRLYEDYLKVLEGLGLRAKRVEEFSDTVEKGRIVTTRPAPGEKATAGQEITVVVSKGPETVAVPNVSGMTVTEADERLRSVGLFASNVRGSPSKLVVGSEPKAGTQVRKGSGVTLITR